MKLYLKIIIGVVLSVVLSFVTLLGYLTIVDYNPELELDLKIEDKSSLEVGNEITVMTWNLGFAGLGSDSDFFMDGGEGVNPSKAQFQKNYQGIKEVLDANMVDVFFIQEIDRDSKRTFYKDMHKEISEKYPNYDSAHAINYKVPLVFIPFPPIGKVTSGITTLSKYDFDQATRIGFDANYSWPTKILHLDRCLLVSRHQIKGSTKELVMINLHLSAYDDGGLRAEQLKVLKELMTSEYENGNYVIAGGDFNQQFPSIDNSKYPVLYPDNYLPNTIENDYLDNGWNYAVSEEAPTYRLLNEVYNKETAQTGVIDGFIVSPNIEIVTVKNLDLEFEYSDHNPVVASFKLK